MLKQRILTALVLLAILLPALFYPTPWPFALVILVLMAAGAWEWGRLNGCSFGASLVLGGVCVVLCAATWWWGYLAQSLPQLWMLAGVFWVLGSAAMLRSGVAGWPRVPRPVRIIGGILALWLAWLAAVQARMVGVNFLLSALALVWMADIAAYFSGRAFGLRFTKNKLAPSISPGKSWEGVWGGAVGVLLMAVVWVVADAVAPAAVASLFTQVARHGVGWLLPALLFMTAMSVIGDLVESLIKRAAGAKDSSQLLPGHGGVLDRVDALLPTLPLAMMFHSLLRP